MSQTVAVDTEWERIEREAYAQSREDAVMAEHTPMEFGRPVAWSECRFGRTDSLSLVHREQDDRTLCGELVPAPILRVALTPNLVRTLGKCRYCETAFAQKGRAA